MSLAHVLPAEIIDIIYLGSTVVSHRPQFYVISAIEDIKDNQGLLNVYITSGNKFIDVKFRIDKSIKKIIGTSNINSTYYEYLLKHMRPEIEQLEKNINDKKYDSDNAKPLLL